MRRLARLHTLWNWLPAFRAVAEAEHLPTAGKRLHVSASALSRAVRLLEREVGRPLFRRAGRRLVLSAEGAAMLQVVRTAMREIDGAIDLVSGQTFAGPVVIAAPSSFVPLFVLPVLSRLQARHPRLVPRVITAPAPEVRRRLLDGSLDVALLDDPEPDPELVAVPLRSIAYGVYCGPGHPLYRKRRPSLGHIMEHPFVAPPGGLDDHWPPHIPRLIGLEVWQLELGVQACARGDFLAVLPQVVVAALPVRLRRLPVDHFAASWLFLVHRRHLTPPSTSQLLVEALLRS